ncbi:MAG: parallel beta-helix domain-containing protein [Blastocatellia bacterium]
MGTINPVSKPNRLRFWLFMLLIAIAAIFGAFTTLGMKPMTPDRPDLAGNNGAPGEGGVRRAFPQQVTRPDNPASAERVELGRLLYYDPVLSGNNEQSCATCHHPDLGFGDGRGQSMGFGGIGLGPGRTGGKEVRRGAPTVWNAGFTHRLFWDGRAGDLEDQAKFPITSEDEMNQKPEELVSELKAIPEYKQLFDRAFGGSDGSAITFENTVNAIAAFERTLVSNNSAFDRYAAGDVNAMSAPARRGLTLFRSLKTRCFECHGFPTFANQDFKVIGVPDLAGQKPDLGRAEIVNGEKQYERAFKVPTLRNVALTAPYMHNGKFKTLEEVVNFYASGGGVGQGLNLPNLDDKIRQFTLTEAEKGDLIAFLKSLTDESKLPAVPGKVPSGMPVVPRLKRNAAELADLPPPPPLPAPTGAEQRKPITITVNAGGSIQQALDRAAPGDTIEVKPGTYREALLVDHNNITLRGLVENNQRAVLEGDNKLRDALISSSDNFTIEGFEVRNYTANGLTVHGANKVAFRNLLVSNTGLYGVYPVETKGVLVENVKVTGIRDAAIYVGQSRDIVVRNNEAFKNVTGIEIENSVNALVENNTLYENTTGLLVFLLPNNVSKVGSDCRVTGNKIYNNNTPNFGDPTAIVGQVPAGGGMIIMAADRTEVTGNDIHDNNSFGVSVFSLAAAFPKGKTFDVGIVPEGTWIHGNKFANNGKSPAKSVADLGGANKDIIWDGSGGDNRFDEPAARSFPSILPGTSWPGFANRAWSRMLSFVRDRIA